MYLWYVDVPGVPREPVGVYDHPPDPAFATISSVNVGGSAPARWLATGTRYYNDALDLINSLNPLG